MLVRTNLIINTVLSTTLTLVYGAISTGPSINDTIVVSSSVHETKVQAPSTADSIGAAASAFKSADRHRDDDDDGGLGDIGFKKSHKMNDHDGYNNFKSFHTKDGDGFGYAEHYEFGKKGNGKKGGGYQASQDFDDEDEAADSLSPKYTLWHFEEGSKTPGNAKSYHYRGDGSGELSKGKLVGPDYKEDSYSFFDDDETTTDKNSKRSKRKKEPHQTAATEYDNYEYADVEEPEEGEAEEGGDPEYGAVYADADAYDYY